MVSLPGESFLYTFNFLEMWKTLVIFSYQNFEFLDTNIKISAFSFLFQRSSAQEKAEQIFVMNRVTYIMLFDAYYELVAACHRNGETGKTSVVVQSLILNIYIGMQKEKKRVVHYVIKWTYALKYVSIYSSHSLKRHYRSSKYNVI